MRYSGCSTSTTYADYELETAKDGLAEDGRHRESLDEALIAASLARQRGASQQLRENLSVLLLSAAAALGISATTYAIAGLSLLDDPESARALCLQADAALATDRLPEAVTLLERARTLALDSRHYSLLVGVLHRLGIVLHESGRSEDALEILEEALLRAKAMPTETDVWAILWELARIAHERDDHPAAIARLERALKEPRRDKNEERLAQTHELLAMLLVESEPLRAIDHMSARMAHGGHINEDMPEPVRQAANAFKAGQYREARSDYESLLSAGEAVPAKRTCNCSR